VNIALPPDLEKYVESLVQTGRYSKSSDVVEEALRHHRLSRAGLEVVMTPELEKLLDEGMEDLAQAKTTDELRRPQ
jgi:putative addiction module CopG family antidote